MIPKISCVMVTNGKRSVDASYRCYLNQTYPKKELIILTQGDPAVIKAPEAVIVPAPPDISLGDLRNASLELASGDIVCQWDDDDLSYSRRLETQYKALLSDSDAVASLYTEYLKLIGNRVYWIDCERGTPCFVELIKKESYKKFLAGTIMLYKSYFHQNQSLLYPDQNNEEDLVVLKKLVDHAVGVRSPHYIYVYHGSNTYSFEHHCRWGLHKKHICQKEELWSRQQELAAIFNDVGLEYIEVCYSDILDFDDSDTELGTDIAFRYPIEDNRRIIL
jgi:glycosyltransferase involved in cell wall biosynthesis